MQEHQPKITMQIRVNPAAVADPRKVRIGGESPSFGPVLTLLAPGIPACSPRFSNGLSARVQ